VNTGRQRQHRAWRFGRFAESLCAWHLRLRGYRVVARSFRSAVGEIDIVARRGSVLAVVEVKGRGDLAAAAESVGRRQRRRIARATEAFVKARPGYAGLDLRFDVMLVRPWRLPRHLTGAWRADDR
jgi:putative endonuclease